MSKPIAAIANIRWDVDGYRDLSEEALFLLGDTEEERRMAEDTVVQRIEAGALDANRMAQIIVMELDRLQWLVVRTGQATSCNFIVTTDVADIEYIRP